MNLGLKDSDLDYIIKIIKNFPQVKKAVIFGSRAKGNFKNGFDIDIAIYGENINFDILSKIHWELEEESPMPYLFDIVDYTHLNHKELKEHIQRVGKTIYEGK